MTNSKKPTRKQNIARMRNWQKARITGIHIDEGFLTQHEKDLYNNILVAREELLKYWDINTRSLNEDILKQTWI